MGTKDANIRLNGDASGLVRATAVAQGALGKLQTQMTALETLSAKSFTASGIVGIGLSATAAAAALIAAVKSAADYGDALDNMSKRTGESVENLSRLQFAAKMSDVSNEALAKGLNYLTVQITGAAHGAEDSSKLFEKYGVAVRNLDGTVRGTTDVLGDLADVFATMPDGPEKAALATEFFGKKLGVELIPLLNEGKEGIKALGDEAERLGLVLSGEQARAAAEFNDNLDRMSMLGKAAAVAIGNSLIPSINEYAEKLKDANKVGLGFWDRFFVARNDGEDPVKMIKSLTAELEVLRKKRDEMIAAGNFGFGLSRVKDDIDENARRLAYYQETQNRLIAEEKKAAADRKSIALNLARELANLEQLRAIAAGKASADILKDDKTRTAEQIKEAEKLRDALRSAWETSRSEATKAADEATKLLEKAAGIRTGAKDKATQMREAGLSEEEKQAAARGRAEDALGQGSFFAAAAGAAKLDGRAKDFEKYAKQAEQFLERAQKFAEESGDANLVEDAGNKQAALLEQQAKAKQAEAAALQERAAGQLATLNEVEAKLTTLQAKAAAIEVQVKIDEAIGKVAELQKQFDALKDKTVTVTVNEVKGGSPASASNLPMLEPYLPTPDFDIGGWTGPGSKFKPAGIVHADEFVITKERTNEPGALDFLWRFHRLGMSALKGYAGGGHVSMPIPTLSPASGPAAPAGKAPLVLDFGKLGRYQAETAPDTAAELTRVFRRAAAQFGRS